jgi:hypothetical protein
MSLDIDPADFGTPDPEPPEDPWDEAEPPAIEDPDAEFERRNRFELRVNTKLDELRVLDEARDRLAAQKAAALTPTPFDAGLLEEILARPAEPAHRVDGLIPSQAGTLVVAQRKVGKTTFDLNLARCLLIGAPFLGRFDVRPVEGRVGFLNYEVSAAQLARWADEAGVDRKRLYLVNLRGRRNPLSHQDDRAELAQRLRDHEVEALFVDPFSRAYTGKSQNDPGEVAAWLVDLDRFARTDANALDIVLNAHAGWDGERTRGASALEDWADSIITLVTDPEDRTIRFMRAMGRDIDVDEDRLHYDPQTRTLSLTGDGNRASVHATKRLDDQVTGVVELVTAAPGIITSGIEAALREMGFPLQRGDASTAARAAVDRGLIERVPGKRRAQHHYLKGQNPPVTPSSPDYPPGPLVSTPDPSYRDWATDSLLVTTSNPDSLADVIDLIPGTVIAPQETP